jgi:hypothetical protein
MTASRQLKTPTMPAPLRSQVTDNEAVKFTGSFAKLTLNKLIAGRQGRTVRETLAQSESGLWQRAYYVTLNFHQVERTKTAFGLTLKEIAKVMAKTSTHFGRLLAGISVIVQPDGIHQLFELQIALFCGLEMVVMEL